MNYSFFAVDSAASHKFYEAGKGKSCHDSDFHNRTGIFVTNSLTCKYAAKRLGKMFETIVNDKRYPKGCIIELTGTLGMKAFFNENLAKQKSNWASPICTLGKYKIQKYNIHLCYACFQIILFNKHNFVF